MHSFVKFSYEVEKRRVEEKLTDWSIWEELLLVLHKHD